VPRIGAKIAITSDIPVAKKPYNAPDSELLKPASDISIPYNIGKINDPIVTVKADSAQSYII
jgi:hypothetical protein